MDVAGPLEVRLGDPDDGEGIRLLPRPRAGEPSALSAGTARSLLSAPGPVGGGSLRLVLAFLVVAVAAYASTALLGTLGLPPAADTLGFTWFALIGKVDELLEQRGVGRRPPSGAPDPAVDDAPGVKRILYGALFLVGMIYVTGIVVLLLQAAGLGGTTLDLLVPLLAAPALLFAVGFWAGERFERSVAVPYLFAVTALAVFLLLAVDFAALPADEFESVYGLARTGGTFLALLFVLGTVYGVLAALFGRWGVRRGAARRGSTVA